MSTSSWGVTIGTFPVKEFVGQIINQGVINTLSREHFFSGLVSNANQWGELGSFWSDILGIGNSLTLVP